MNRTDFLHLVKQCSNFVALQNILQQKNEKGYHLKGLIGSSFSSYFSKLQLEEPNNHLLIFNDREQALYYQNDIDALLGENICQLFPASYKRPYQYDEVDNANVLERAEVLNSINESPNIARIIITYPEAITEKVISQKTLVKNTFGVKVGDEIDFNFLSEILFEYGFSKTDFVYEPGNFSIRGGIIDIFSFSNDLPYRIELFGNDIESIRTFDTESQLSVDEKTHISIIPDVQTKLLEETRESFLDYINSNSKVWVADLSFTKEVINKSFEKANENLEHIQSSAGAKTLITDAKELFENGKSFLSGIQKFQHYVFGTKAPKTITEVINFQTEGQTSFNKQFSLLTENLLEFSLKGYTNIISAESIQQINRLENIIEQHDNSAEFQVLNLPLHAGYIDHDLKLLVYSDHQIFERYHKYKVKERHSKSTALTIQELKNLAPGDFITHIDHGVGRFAGMQKKVLNNVTQETIRLIFRDDDVLYINVHNLHKIAKYSGKEGEPPSMSKLGSPEWEKKKSKVKSRVKKLAFDLISLYAKRKESKGFAYSKDTFLQAELESSFFYEDTPDQAKATDDVKADMELIQPMDRLVCGDVGFGKTEVAIRAAFKAVSDGKQVAVLVPTTILALQHFNNFAARLKNLPCRVDFINRFRTAKETREVLADLKEGKVDILIGTHKLVGKSVEFKDLGLLIIDEEQKFGVAIKDKLKSLKVNVDVLTLTATPIPRTLQFSLMGARDLSVIATPPANRRPVVTEVHSLNNELLRDAVSYEIKRGGQVFFVHNRIASIEEIGGLILKLVPDARVAIAHGQMDGKHLEKTMMKFIEHEYDVLVSTSIIESGLDISNANTIIINQSHMYGLSDLHQMRGRVGRSNKKAFCYLTVPSMSSLTSDARKRLQTLEEFSELGDGFKVAMKDLDIRGSGDLLGAEQSGFINDLGMDTYHKILQETVQELKEDEFKELFKDELDLSVLKTVDCNIETDLSLFIPETYVENISERLRLYNALDNTKNKEDLDQFKQSLVDRFGPIPKEAVDLMESVELRWLAEKLGFEKLRLKTGYMKGYVRISNNDAYFQSDIFGRLLAHIQSSKNCNLKEVKDQMVLTFKNVSNVTTAIEVLSEVK